MDEGADDLSHWCRSAFRLLSDVSAAGARAGMQRLFAAVPEDTAAQEPFFQAGFYSYTREGWYVSVASVAVQAVINLTLLQREFRHRLAFPSQDAPA